LDIGGYCLKRICGWLPALRRLKEKDDCKVEASLDCIARPCLRKIRTEKGKSGREKICSNVDVYSLVVLLT
jgi:hypothetical protein